MAPIVVTSTTSPHPVPNVKGRVAFWFLVGFVCLASALLPGPPLLGEWEGLSVFTIFGSQTTDIAFVITRSANVGGQGYPLLEVSRYLIDWLQLPFTLDLVRLPVKLMGAVGLAFFAIVARRWFGPWPALAATALLAVNPMYHQFQNELIVVMPSLVALIVLIERLQYLARNPTSWTGWLTIALVWTLLLTMYGPSRIFSTILIFFWLVIVVIRVLRGRSGYLKGAMVLRGSVLIGLVPLLLLLAAPSNVRYFGIRLFLPPGAESVVAHKQLEGAARAITANARVMLESFFLGGRGTYHSDFVEATLIQGRYTTIPLLLAPVVLLSFGVVVRRAWALRRKGISRYLVILGLAALTSLPMLTSSILPGENGPEPTLVNHRLIFFVVPAYLAVAALVAVFGSGSRMRRILTASLTLGFVMTGAVQILIGHANFVARSAAVDPHLIGSRGQAQWLDGYSLGGKGLSQGSHFQQHEQYKRWATSLASNIKTRDAPTTLIVPTAVTCFPEAELVTHTLRELDGINYHGMFLSLYLSSALDGKAVGYVNVPSLDSPVNIIMFKSGIFPGALTEDQRGSIDYEEPEASSARVMVFGEINPEVIVTTTPTDLNVAREHLGAEQRDFIIVNSDQSCWGAK